MREIDKLFAEGVTLEQIQKAYAEAQEKAVAADKRKKNVEIARKKFVTAGSNYLKTLGLDLPVEGCTALEKEFVESLLSFEKIVGEMSNENVKTIKAKRITDTEIDNLLNKIFSDLF